MIGLMCDDCGRDIGITYSHPLVDKVWLKANGKEKGLLCFGCIQKNLGRALVQSDFYYPESFRKMQIRGLL